MRLTDTQVCIIKARAAECFGSNAKIWLFGSRVDDKALGGDIDLYVELTEPFTDAAWRALRFNGALQQVFGAQHIDVITRGPSEPLKVETDPRDGQAIRRRSVNDLAARLARVLDLVDREARHLAAITQRFFGDIEAIDREWLERQLATPEGIDRLESFDAKFSRLQDTLSDKLLPLFLRAAGELPGTVVENLNRAERLGIIRDTQEWLGARAA